MKTTIPNPVPTIRPSSSPDVDLALAAREGAGGELLHESLIVGPGRCSGWFSAEWSGGGGQALEDGYKGAEGGGGDHV